MLIKPESHTRKFHLVDFAAHFQKGFRNHVVPITQVPTLVQVFSRYGCYATYIEANVVPRKKTLGRLNHTDWRCGFC